jgi:hypothetical protein
MKQSKHYATCPKTSRTLPQARCSRTSPATTDSTNSALIRPKRCGASKDPHHRILAHQRSRFTHYYFYIRDEVLGLQNRRLIADVKR